MAALISKLMAVAGHLIDPPPAEQLVWSRKRLCWNAGVSVSTISRSTLSVEPEGTDAQQLRSWWENEGCTATISSAGEGLPTARYGLTMSLRPARLVAQALRRSF